MLQIIQRNNITCVNHDHIYHEKELNTPFNINIVPDVRYLRRYGVLFLKNGLDNNHRHIQIDDKIVEIYNTCGVDRIMY